jgi:Spy/CpxP family protein refolding chaperone
MRKVVFAAALAAGVVGLSSSAFATMAMHMPTDFGPVYEMAPKMMKHHMMHMAVIQDDSGAKYVVMPIAEAEMIFGPITAPAMHYAGK